MALNLSSSPASSTTAACSKLHYNSKLQFNSLKPNNLVIKCEGKESSGSAESKARKSSKLEIGSPVVIIEAPKTIKTAAAIPCLRINSGLVNPGDVGRIISRKPKDVWAIRLSIGTYLIDGKYFQPLEVED